MKNSTIAAIQVYTTCFIFCVLCTVTMPLVFTTMTAVLFAINAYVTYNIYKAIGETKFLEIIGVTWIEKKFNIDLHSEE